MSDTQEVGWQVVDRAGNVVQSGSVSIARAAGVTAEAIKQAAVEAEKE